MKVQGHTKEVTIVLPGDHKCAEETSQVREHLSDNLENMNSTDEERKETHSRQEEQHEVEYRVC